MYPLNTESPCFRRRFDTNRSNNLRKLAANIDLDVQGAPPLKDW